MSLPSHSQPHQLKQSFKRGIFMQSIRHETTPRGCKISQALVLLKSLLWSLSVPQAGKQLTSVNFSIHPFQNNKNNLSCLKLCFLLIIFEMCSCFYFVFILLLLPKRDLLQYAPILILSNVPDTQKMTARNDNILCYMLD